MTITSDKHIEHDHECRGLVDVLASMCACVCMRVRVSVCIRAGADVYVRVCTYVRTHLLRLVRTH